MSNEIKQARRTKQELWRSEFNSICVCMKITLMKLIMHDMRLKLKKQSRSDFIRWTLPQHRDSYNNSDGSERLWEKQLFDQQQPNFDP